MTIQPYRPETAELPLGVALALVAVVAATVADGELTADGDALAATVGATERTVVDVPDVVADALGGTS